MSYDLPDDDPLPASGYRTYEVYQRERVGDAAPPLRPRELYGDEMLSDPYRLLGLLREHTPCYRDWVGNRFWVTRYDDVTSLFVDDANFETRPTSWWLGLDPAAVDLWSAVPVLQVRADRIDASAADIVDRLLDEAEHRAANDGVVDIALSVAARLPIELWCAVLGVPADEMATFADRSWRLQRGVGWDESDRLAAHAAFGELVDWVSGVWAGRAGGDDGDLVSVATTVDGATPTDVAHAVLEADHATLHGGLANLWYLLLSDPEQLDVACRDERLVKFAWLEALRHSPPVMSAYRFTRHEVERFGCLLPQGALVELSAGAANRDPRVFTDPERFLVERADLCQREPRGHYRADGLPSGIAFGLGPPSPHPAVPRERPRSSYAFTRDVAVMATRALLDRFPNIRIAGDASPTIRSLQLGGMRTCWNLAVRL